MNTRKHLILKTLCAIMKRLPKKHLQEKLFEALKNNRGIIKYACEASGVSRSLYYKWIKEDEKFAAMVEEINEEQLDFVEHKFLDRINSGSDACTIFYLKTKGRTRGYEEKSTQSIELSGKDGEAIEFKFGNDTEPKKDSN